MVFSRGSDQSRQSSQYTCGDCNAARVRSFRGYFAYQLDSRLSLCCTTSAHTFAHSTARSNGYSDLVLQQYTRLWSPCLEHCSAMSTSANGTVSTANKSRGQLKRLKKKAKAANATVDTPAAPVSPALLHNAANDK